MRGVACAGLLVLGGMGCAGPEREAAAPAVRDQVAHPGLSSATGHRSQVTVDPSFTVESWTEAVLADSGNPALESSGERLAEGRAAELFEVFLGRAANHVPDTSRWVRLLAEWVGRYGSDAGVARVIADLAGRECCLRRAYLAAGLEGLTRGLDSAGASVKDPSALARVAVLAGNRDPAVAAAATALLRMGTPDH